MTAPIPHVDVSDRYNRLAIMAFILRNASPDDDHFYLGGIKPMSAKLNMSAPYVFQTLAYCAEKGWVEMKVNNAIRKLDRVRVTETGMRYRVRHLTTLFPDMVSVLSRGVTPHTPGDHS